MRACAPRGGPLECLERNDITVFFRHGGGCVGRARSLPRTRTSARRLPRQQPHGGPRQSASSKDVAKKQWRNITGASQSRLGRLIISHRHRYRQRAVPAGLMVAACSAAPEDGTVSPLRGDVYIVCTFGVRGRAEGGALAWHGVRLCSTVSASRHPRWPPWHGRQDGSVAL